MAGKRKQHTAAFKAQVALAALKGDKTVNELASQYGAHPTLIHGWKKQLLAGADQVFQNGSQAATAALKVNEVITQVNGRPVSTPADFYRESAKVNGALELTIEYPDKRQVKIN